ncbi:hypothetical protein QUF74_10580 [Candidatus Halobeggiatoa sp. HSG11]|nr:hypothetical protein [Candidatus Halobeggiatoa sp. HSG11]
MKKISSKKAMLLASAGKLALVPGLASAQGGKGDESAPADPAPQLKLNQVAVPFDAFIPPFNDPDMMGDGSMFEDELEGYESTGVIFVGEMDERARMDFVISNIRNDMPVDVYLVMGTELAADAEDDLFPGLAPTEFRGPQGHSDHMVRDGKDRPPEPRGPGAEGSGAEGPGMEGPGAEGPGMGEMGEQPGAGGENRTDLEKQLEQLFIQLDDQLMSEAPDEREINRLDREIHKIERKLMKAPPEREGNWKGIGSKPKPKSNAAPSMPVHGGEICIDMASLEVIAAVRVHPNEPLMPPNDVSIGKAVPTNFTSAIVSVNLMKEKLLRFEDQEVFFQAAIMPANDPRPINELLAEGGQVSECDRYVISNVIEADEEYDIEADDGGKEGGDYGDEYDDSGELFMPENDYSEEDNGGKGV